MFQGFVLKASRYGTEEAKKRYDLENYTVGELIKIIEAEGFGDVIDFVYSRHNKLLATEDEAQAAGKDFAAAKDSGINLDKVKWHDKGEMLSVSSCCPNCSPKHS